MSTERGVLQEIVALRRQRIREARQHVPLDSLEKAAALRRDRRDFAAALCRGPLAVIAESKKASPSAGVLRREYDSGQIAKAYEASGASAISVLTEPDFFLGSLEDLRKVRSQTMLPVLRKDFILERYQVAESVAAGADALLLIVAALSDAEMRALMDESMRLKIAALVEVHDREELDRALSAGAHLIGVNNRNLKTLEVDLSVSLRLRESIPAGCVAVSESGIRAPEDLRRLACAGFDAVLIGECFMRSPDPGLALAEMLAGAGELTSTNSYQRESRPGAAT